MPTNDHTKHPAKATGHEDTHHQQKPKYEHEDITDNRLVWEVLEDVDETGA